MWMIRGKSGFEIYKFTDRFVTDILLWACENEGVDNTAKINGTNMTSELEVLAKNGRYRRLRNEMIKLANCKEIKKVNYIFNFYKNKYINIVRGDVKQRCKINEETLEILRGMFGYFYEQLIDNKKLWEAYGHGEDFKRKTEIRELIGENRVCPYCDQGYLESTRKNNMDHYLPREKFPFLSLHWRNIIISCISCNGILVKGSNWFLPILHPYFDKIEDVVIFDFDRNNQEIDICINKRTCNISRAKKRTYNFIQLFNFKDLYSGSWAEVENEKNLIDKEIECMYHINKFNLNKENIYEILVEKSIENRKCELKNKAGKLAFAKLKYDYAEHYKENCDYELLEWLICENEHRLKIK